jgi:demethoxyubiquinone hydroxylase (CLK1/Coq7/Cat5 family)
MTYRVILEHLDGGLDALGDFETRREALTCINQYRLDDEGHDHYNRLWIEDSGRVIYKHASTNYLVERYPTRQVS